MRLAMFVPSWLLREKTLLITMRIFVSYFDDIEWIEAIDAIEAILPLLFIDNSLKAYEFVVAATYRVLIDIDLVFILCLVEVAFGG